ncbi:tetratricopeptide repeat protein [bacterium]|nr:tetratricopeptide repeat protein [bacterium]
MANISKKDAKLEGNRYFQKEEYEKSIASYGLAIHIDPKYTSAYINRAYAYEELNEYEKAASDYKKITQIDNKDSEAFFRLAVMQDELGDYKGALNSYKKVIKLDPDNHDAIFNQSIVLEELGEFKKACKGIKTFLSYNSSDVEANEKLKELTIKSSLNNDFLAPELHEQAMNFLQQERHKKAESSFSHALSAAIKNSGKKDPKTIPYLSSLLELYLINFKDTEALKSAKEIRSIKKKKNLYQSVLFNRADIWKTIIDILEIVEADPTGQEATDNAASFKVCIDALKVYEDNDEVSTPFDRITYFQKEILFKIGARFDIYKPKSVTHKSKTAAPVMKKKKRRMIRQKKIFTTGKTSIPKPVATSSNYITDLTSEPGSCSTELVVMPGIWSWEPSFPEIDDYGYIVLRDIHKTEVIIDGTTVKIEGGFRGFKGVPSGIHEIIVEGYQGEKIGVKIDVPDGGCLVLRYDYNLKELIPDRTYGYDYISKALRHVMDSYLYEWS